MEQPKFNLIWPAIFAVTIVLYILILVYLPFDQLMSTIFLFALIGFWSRLPGVGMDTPLYILYFADIIDFLAIILVINVSPIVGATYSFAINILSRLCGTTPRWDGVLKDTAAQYFACLLVPYILPLTGGNLEATMGWYTVIRCILFIPGRLIPDGTNWIQFWVYEILAASIAMYLVNIFYARYFGWFFEAMIAQGTSFNWFLFIGVSIIIWQIKKRLYPTDEKPVFQKLIKNLIQKHRKRKQKKQSIDDNITLMTEIKDSVEHFHIPRREYAF
jgi:hypothetical protein